MKKKLAFLMMMLVGLACMPAMAKKDPQARKVLDAVASKLRSCGGIKANFTVSSYLGTKKQGTENGTFSTDGKRFVMKTQSATIWFDGTTQWSYFPSSDEVNITNPSSAELQSMNPYAFIDIYKNGFSYTMTDGKYQGKSVNEITLKAENRKQSIKQILLTVDKSTNLPYCVRVLEGKTWTRINISNFQGGQKYSANTFKFDKKKYPKADIIDLR